jgi:hypothetical protein
MGLLTVRYSTTLWSDVSFRRVSMVCANHSSDNLLHPVYRSHQPYHLATPRARSHQYISRCTLLHPGGRSATPTSTNFSLPEHPQALTGPCL